MTSAGARSRSASRTSVWYRRSAVSPASAARSAGRSAAASAAAVVLRREQHLGRFLGDLSGNGVDPAIEERRRIGAFRPFCGARLDRGPQRFEPREALGVTGSARPRRCRRRSSSASRGDTSGRLDLRSPGWRRRRSRSRGRSVGGRCRSSRPSATVCRATANGSGPRRSRRSPPPPPWSMYASMRTRPSWTSWTTAGTRPSAANRTADGSNEVNGVTRPPVGRGGPEARRWPSRP